MASNSSFKLIISLIFLLFTIVSCDKWDYTENSPNVWPLLEGDSFKQCKSDLQSPIHIKTDTVKCDAARSIVKPIELKGYNLSYQFNFSNSGLTILSQLADDNVTLLFTGSGLKKIFSPFELKQFHFHWGNSSTSGSEHIIDNKTTPLELHLVHSSTKDRKYFAVIGILFQISKTPNPNLEGLLKAADYLATHPNSHHIENVNLSSLIPNYMDRFYYYEGSLTTPPCTEAVFWTVMADKISISEDQLRRIQANPSKINFRPVQPINQRTVTTIDCELAGFDNASSHLVKSNIFSLSFLIIFFLSILF